MTGVASRRWATARSTSSSCRPTRPGPSTSGMPGARSSATCSVASSRPAASASRASTTSTIRARRSRTLVHRSSLCDRAGPSPTTAIEGSTWPISPRPCPPTCGQPRPRRMPTPTGSSGRWAAGRIREGIEQSLAALGVRFDVWTSEARLHEEGWVGRAIERLRERGHVYEQDGAIWFRSTAFGDDKDRVIIRSNGEPTYFAADIGYLAEKFSRGFDDLIYIWGADHHGTVARVRNAAEAMGYDREAVRMLLYSWVRFVRDGAEVSMSKRAGEFITLDELLAEVGVDAARWFFASRGATSAIDFDIELAKKQSNENPVYYVQYAHARIASIMRKAAESGLAPAARRRGVAGRRARGRPGPGRGEVPGGRGGRRRRRGDPGHHGLRDRAGHDLPRLLPRCPGRGPRRAAALRVRAWPLPRRRGSPWPTPCGCWESRLRTRCSPALRRRGRGRPASGGRVRRRSPRR